MAKNDPSEMGKKGGKARAKSLSAETRSEIARKAAAARWSKEGEERGLPKAICGGKEPLRIGKLEIPCYVLEEGFVSEDEDRRVITVSGLQGAIGMGLGGGATRLASFAAQIAPNSTASNDLAARLESPVQFIMPQGGLAKGYTALLLADLCDVILEARKNDMLSARYKPIADAAEAVMRGLANVAIVALIDEATGYEKIRKRQSLAEVLDRYLSDKLNPWTKTFPDEYYEHLFRLKGWDYERLRPGDGKPAEVGKITREVVYRRLHPGIVEELEKQNPEIVPGRRLYKHHQWLSDEIGHPALREHLAKIVTVMKLSDGWVEFERNLGRAVPMRDEQAYFDEFFKDD